MKIPESISIGGVEFKITIRDLNGDFGEMKFDRREIRIAPDLDDDDFLTTLRHEMLHAALTVAGHSYAEKYDEEPIVRALENIFFPAWDKLTEELYG